jgi:hypothetical protein
MVQSHEWLDPFLQERINQAVVEGYPTCIDATKPASYNRCPHQSKH